MATKGKLGRGLSALIPSSGKEETDLRELSISNIKPNPNQPRKDFETEAFNELVLTIKQLGVIQPVIVTEKEEETFEIVAGERRWRAAQKAGLRTIPCVVKQTTEVTSVQMALVENLQRQDLNPIEEASAYEYLLNDGGLTQEKLAKILGLSRPYITNTIRLLKLPDEVRDSVVKGDISQGHARAIAALKDEKQQIKLARKVLARGLSVRETEAAVYSIWHPVQQKKSSSTEMNQEQELLTKALGLKVTVRQNKDGGVVSIYYEKRKQLKNIVKRITKQRS